MKGEKKMLFKVYSGYECGGPEDGMICKSYTSYIEAETAEEAEKKVKEYNKDDSDFLGCRAEEATEEEVKMNEELERELKEYQEFMERMGL